MGNHHSASQHSPKPRKNVHWKSAGRPAPPGKPEIIPLSADEEPNAITLRWRAGAHDGGAPLRGYRVECNRVGAPEWIHTSPPVVQRPELVLSGLEPPHRYRFRVAALNAVGASDYSELSDVLTVTPEPAPHRPPVFVRHLEDRTVLENDKTEFRVTFEGAPPPSIAWFKDDYEIFSSRRTAISTDDTSSVLVFHQTLASDEGEIRCTATNRSGHAVTRARLAIEAPPKLRYPRQYEDGLLYEINETVFLKVTVVGKPPPAVEWYHDGRPIAPDDRTELTSTPKFSVLKIQAARRSDRGEYQVHARNGIGEDSAAFLVTVTAPPEPPRRVTVTRQVDKSVTLAWDPPEDDGGCRVGNYVVEYYRAGWNVWLKATTSRKTSVTLFDLIEGSEYRFRVKAESPYGMSAPSERSPPVRIPGRAVDMDFLAVESRIIGDALAQQEGEARVSPAPRRKRSAPPSVSPSRDTAEPPAPISPPTEQRNDEFMLVLYPESTKTPTKAEKRESFQLEAEWASPPPLSLSAPELSTRCAAPFRALRHSVSSTELLHEHAMARFYKALAMREEQDERAERQRRTEREERATRHPPSRDIPNANTNDRQPSAAVEREPPRERELPREREPPRERELARDRANSWETPRSEPEQPRPPLILVESQTSEERYGERQESTDSLTEHRWQHSSFEDDYTASTVSTDGEYSDEGSLDGDSERAPYAREEDTYNPRDKVAHRDPTADHEHSPQPEPLKLLPLPDPNFVPKPILKKREIPVTQQAPAADAQKPNGKQITDEKPKKETIFKKITKMPKQKSFPFPKILSKKEPEKIRENDVSTEKDHRTTKKVEPDKISDEGKTIIDYYGNILKEYGAAKKPAAPLYLNTEDLKTVAEKQQCERNTDTARKEKVTKVKKTATSKTIGAKKSSAKANNVNSTHKAPPETRQTATAARVESEPVDRERDAAQRVLLTTERATVVIPIDYGELEKKAKVKVRGAIDCAVDVCLLALAFWLYLFEDERLAVPFLLLLVYRQLAQTARRLPAALRRYAPAALLKKTS